MQVAEVAERQPGHLDQQQRQQRPDRARVARLLIAKLAMKLDDKACAAGPALAG